MARREVLEVTCDRCERVETQTKSEAKKPEGVTLELKVNFRGEAAEYEDLCRRCRDAVGSYYAKIVKKVVDKDPEKSAFEPVVVKSRAKS